MSSNLTHEQALNLLASFSLALHSDVLPGGDVRIETPFKYPDGTSIEVFIEADTPLPAVRLSDQGQTTAWLLNLDLKPWLNNRRRVLMEDALHTYGVELSGGKLVLALRDATALPEGVIRMSQACIRVADLSFTLHSSPQSTFFDRLEEDFEDATLPDPPRSES